ncbi:MAG: hypothetical protein LBS39_02140 [Campylobacteraceae bacterium]|nr:hypothetical protein [Campylobacteraceae bacterium]
MYGKKVFATLVALFCLFSLSGCGGGKGSGIGGGGGDVRSNVGLSIHEYDYFPELNIPTVKVNHDIQRIYRDINEANVFVNDFKAKGPYSVYMDLITRKDPMSDGGSIVEAAMFPLLIIEYYDILMSIEINGTDTITRDDDLFEVIFGDTNAPILAVYATKEYLGDQTAQFEAYSNSLESLGFYKASTRLWMKQDLNQDIAWSWGYNIISEYNKSVAIWGVTKSILP